MSTEPETTVVEGGERRAASETPGTPSFELETDLKGPANNENEKKEEVAESGGRSHGPSRDNRGDNGRFTTGNEPERFWAKVDTQSPEGCWLWTAARSHDGYGRFRVIRDGRPTHVRAHRWAWEQRHGPTPLPLDHLCRNRSCVRPEHLEPVSTRENARRVHTRKETT